MEYLKNEIIKIEKKLHSESQVLKKKILIFGASGTLGSNIIYYLKKNYNFIIAVYKKKIFFSKVEYCNFSKKIAINEGKNKG